MNTITMREKKMKDGSRSGYVPLSQLVSSLYFGGQSDPLCQHVFKVSATSRMKKCMKCNHIEKEV